MSSLRTLDLREVDDLVSFVQGAGYVLDFSNATFSEFFAHELDIDIDDPIYADLGGSKGKRLKRFFQRVDDRTAIRTLHALWEYREGFLLRTGQKDPIINAQARYSALVRRLGGSAASGPQEAPKPAFDFQKIDALKEQILTFATMDPQPRGYAFEKFLFEMFDVYGMRPREPFRNRGEQIDGSFVLANETYLLEAKWQASEVGVADLRAFEGKVSQKVQWARGLFVSYSGFSADGFVAFGRATKFICMNGLDIHDMLDRRIGLDQVLDRKVRKAAEAGVMFSAVRDLF